MAEPGEAGGKEGQRKIRQRSPAYPFLSLPTAIMRARTLYDSAKKATIPRDAAIQNWGFSAKSSYAQQTVAALKSYGLVEFVEGGLKLTSDALLIVIGEEGNPQRQATIRKAALAPPLFASTWKTYGAELPSDGILVTALVLKGGFPSQDAARDFLGKYKETIEYAKLAESGSISVAAPPEQGGEEPMETEMPALDASASYLPAGPASPATPAGKPAAGTGSDPDSLLLQVPFRGATMTVRVSAGQKLTKAHLERVCAYLKLTGDDFVE
jgi:hypothetical protein